MLGILRVGLLVLDQRQVVLRRLRLSGCSVIDSDVGDRVPFDVVAAQTVSRGGEEDCEAGQKCSPERVAGQALPFCSVSVDVCALTFATRPSTTVFGGFWSVTVTEMPMSAVAMVADSQITRPCNTCSDPEDVR
jgi:hypothetical protein